MATHGIARTTSSRTPAEVLPRIRSLSAQGMSSQEIALLLGLSSRAVRLALQRLREQAADPADTDEDEAPAPLSTLPRRSSLAEADLCPPPPPGREDLPGYAAWQLVHVERLDVRTAVRRLKLRFPSQVFDLLAQHRAALEVASGEADRATRRRTGEAESAASRDAGLSAAGSSWLARVEALDRWNNAG